MANTAHRALRLLSLLGSGRIWPLAELATRLDTSDRTVRRDIDTLRELDYPITTVHGPDGGYRLGTGHTLPPLLFDHDQALAVAVALQTAPSTLFGLADDTARALATLHQVMPPALRAAMDSLRLTRLRNYWEFPAPPIDPATLTTLGTAIHRRHLLLTEPPNPHQLEPHHLVVWAARWYLVAYDRTDQHWRVHRADQLRTRPTTQHFPPRPLPEDDLAHLVMSSYDRGDTPATWPCTGTARLALPAHLVARFAPGGAVVEHLDLHHCRITLGAWSWAGIAGILATFDTDLTDLHPPELVHACRTIAHRLATIPEQ